MNCCYHKHAGKKYAELAIQFLRELPMDGAIGINSVLGTYYEALFNNDQATADEVADVLRKNMGQPLEKYKEVDIYENDIPAKKETAF